MSYGYKSNMELAMRSQAKFNANLLKSIAEKQSNVEDDNTKKPFKGQILKKLDSTWGQAPNPNVLKLSLILLIYVYYEDDGEISKYEKKSIKRVLKEKDFNFSKEDRKELGTFIENRFNTSEIDRFIRHNSMDEGMFKYAKTICRESIKYGKTYTKILDNLNIAF